MMQATEAARLVPQGKHLGATPGLGLTLAIAVISGVVCWFWLASGRANPTQSAAANVSELVEVADGEIDGALGTLGLPEAGLAPFRKAKDNDCRLPLAWVSLVSAPGQPPGRIRLISGAYYSPVFEVTATPVRVALPFPAPYETGRGALSAVDVGGSARVALLPDWLVSQHDGQMVRAVSWKPVKTCSPRNG